MVLFLCIYRRVSEVGFESQFYRVKCNPATGNRVNLAYLRPNTVYYVHLRASLEERGLQGSASPSTRFVTSCAVPERPQPPQMTNRTHYSLIVSWRPTADNGSPIRLYRLEIACVSFLLVYDVQLGA